LLNIRLKFPNHALFFVVLGGFETLKGTSLAASFSVHIAKIPLSFSALGDDKKKRKGTERYAKSRVGYISAIWGEDRVGAISTKVDTFVGIEDLIIQSSFG